MSIRLERLVSPRTAVITAMAVALSCGGVTAAHAETGETSVQRYQVSRTLPLPAAPAEAQVSEVLGADGAVIGYAVDAETRALLDAVAREASVFADSATVSGGEGAQTQSVFKVAKCVAGVAAFIALTVFPTARVARLAVRVGQLVHKHGIKTVAQILTRTYKGKLDGQKIFLEIAKEATGVAGLSVCWT